MFFYHTIDVSAGELDIVRDILNIDTDLIDVNKTNKNGHTPLDVAASCGNEAIVEAFLRKQIEPMHSTLQSACQADTYIKNKGKSSHL